MAEFPNVERLTFFNGQRLTASDMTALDAANREMRWLHNRSMHAWGIGTGFGVIGRRGETVVTVQPGFAVDRLGRELLFTEARTLTVPVVEGAALFYLTARYVADDVQKVLERRSGVCTPEGTVRLSDDAAVQWRVASQLDAGVDIILASVRIRNCVLASDVSLTPRRYARSAPQSYVEAGETTAAATVWQPWSAGEQIVGMMTVVDTSAARFRNVPVYTANIVGERIRSSPFLVAVAFPEVYAPTARNFTLRVMFPAMEGSSLNPPALRDATQGPAILKALGWTVTWMGVED